MDSFIRWLFAPRYRWVFRHPDGSVMRFTLTAFALKTADLWTFHMKLLEANKGTAWEPVSVPKKIDFNKAV